MQKWRYTNVGTQEKTKVQEQEKEKVSGLNIPLPIGLKKRLKRICLEKDIPMTTVIIQLVNDWVEENEHADTPHRHSSRD